MSLNGKKLSKRLTNTLKTILYYQNRVRRKDPRCLISLPNATTLPCPRDSIVSRTRSIHLHFFADSQTRDYVNSSLTKWNLQGVTWTMYSFEQHRNKVDWIPNDHPSGISALIKLTLTELLPKWIVKVIAMDTDVILNSDIAELWNHFYRFGDKQVIGYAWEQNSWSPTCQEPRVSTIPYSGVNGGLALLHLSRMRQVNWDGKWREVLKRILRRKSKLGESDQEVVRELIRKYPELYYKVPCEWNVQVYVEVASMCCPVVWPLRYPDQIDCWSDLYPNATYRPVKLVHYDTHSKPDDEVLHVTLPPISTAIDKKLTTPQVRALFHQLYHKFESLDLSCFH
ncbi:hypothetical protein FBUS_00984 [Fasciolopsis buskii]|uniref:Uncharacterized protein n=1 Tax=Fasciolopsis buskii TaxID=27845 RepID=A0A8E0RQM2_9TREM|nr:hypothetical protein FBUS_00984 [Fasciolopsis buski]